MTHPHPSPLEGQEVDSAVTRRDFLSRATTAGMYVGLVTSYGGCAAMAARFVFPAHSRALGWVFVARIADVTLGSGFAYTTPAGERVTIARQGGGAGADDFIALSSTCPHLGCQVHWESTRERFFCPCHNGTFDRSGRGTGGPPGDAGQSLPRYPLKVEGGLLYIEVALEHLTT